MLAFNRDSFMTSYKWINPAALWTRSAWTTGSCRRVSDPSALGLLTQEATVLGSGAFHCRMLTFIRDSFMTSYKWLNSGTVDALDMDNGLV
jgi:hypothetical protein